MSIDNGTCHLHFPLTSQTVSAQTVIVQDIDVVGVGSLRRHQLEELQTKHQFILQTHGSQIPESVHGIYQAELLRTLQWLRPQKTEAGPALNFWKSRKNFFAAFSENPRGDWIY